MNEREAPGAVQEVATSPDGSVPAISVVIPTCGRSNLLARALSSVRAQSFEDWECVVVNDAPAARASVDALLLGLADVRISACHNATNKGVAAARNAGIARTSGRYLAFLDDDDYWLPDHLSGIIRTHEVTPEPIVIYTDFIEQWQSDIAAPRLTTAKPPPADPTRGLLKGSCHIRTMSTVSLPRCCIDDIGLFDVNLKYGEDWDFYLRASSHYRFVHLRQYSVVYYHHFQGRLTSGYRDPVRSLRVIMSKWQLDPEFVRLKTSQLKHTTVDDMLYASSQNDIVRKIRVLRYFFSIPAPFESPAVLAKLLIVAILPYRLYSLIVRRCNRGTKEAARRLLDSARIRSAAPAVQTTDRPPVGA